MSLMIEIGDLSVVKDEEDMEDSSYLSYVTYLA